MTFGNWQTSSYSGDAGNCINVTAPSEGSVQIRESDTPNTVITTTRRALKALIHEVKAGELQPSTTSMGIIAA